MSELNGIKRRNPFAKNALDGFVAELPKMLKKAIPSLSTDASVESVGDGTGEGRRIVGTADHNGYRLRFLVYVEARNIAFEKKAAEKAGKEPA